MGDTEDNKDVLLDESAQELYRQLGGMDTTLRVDVSMQLESELMQFLQKEEKKRDYFRLLIAQATCLFVDIVAETRIADLDKGNDPKVKIFINVLNSISEVSGKDSKISCRFRGLQTVGAVGGSQAPGAEAYDYELAIEDILLDCQVAAKVEERETVKGKALYAKLMRAFTVMSGMRIFNFTIDIKVGDEQENYRRYLKAIKPLLQFYNPKTGDENFFVLDEYDRPNINLTLLAATNNVRPASLQGLVNQIKPRMLGPDPAPELARFTTVYDVILASKKYQRQLKKMAVEVNSLHQLMLNRGLKSKQSVEAVQVSRLVLAKYGSDPRKVSEIISSISEEGYHNIQTKMMGNRLSQASEFLHLAAESENKDSLHHEALQNIEEGLQSIPDEVYNELNIEGGEVSSIDSEGRETKWSLHEKILGLVSYFKQRALTKGKVRDINNRDIQFDAVDFSVIARSCNVTVEEAAQLVALLKDCFSESGRFKRSSFESNIPAFLKFEDNVFEFLWYYIKELRLKGDRIGFLNSIQLLVSQLKQPEKVLKILLADIFSPTSMLRFSDRNGFILANILLRTYNKEENSHIELTPAEVLFVRVGLSEDMVRVAVDFLDNNRERVLQKVKRLTEHILQFSVNKSAQEREMQMRFLLYLMRELVVFFSLIGGKISQSIVKGVVMEFGDPRSPFYVKVEDKSLVAQGLKLLQVAARGLKRSEYHHDLLHMIAGLEREFIVLYDNPTHRVTVKKVMELLVTPDG
jgi:hypothetical protein